MGKRLKYSGALLSLILFFCIPTSLPAQGQPDHCEIEIARKVERFFHRNRNKFARIVRRAGPWKSKYDAPQDRSKLIPNENLFYFSRFFYKQPLYDLTDDWLCHMKIRRHRFNLNFEAYYLESDSLYYMFYNITRKKYTLLKINEPDNYTDILNAMRRYKPFLVECIFWGGKPPRRYNLFVMKDRVGIFDEMTGEMIDTHEAVKRRIFSQEAVVESLTTEENQN